MTLRDALFEPITAVARIFCMLRKWDVKLQILTVSMVTLLIKDFVQCKLTCKMWLSFWFCVLRPCKISWPQQCMVEIVQYLPCPAFLQPQEAELHFHPQHQPQRVFKPPLVLTCYTFITHPLDYEKAFALWRGGPRRRIWRVGFSGEGKPRDVFYGAGDSGKASWKLTRASDLGDRAEEDKLLEAR
jgi:hypothetical protein